MTIDRLIELTTHSGLRNHLRKLADLLHLRRWAQNISLRSILRRAAREKNLGIEFIGDGENSLIKIYSGRDAILISNRHIQYVQDIINGFNCYFSAVFPRLTSSENIVDFSRPRIHTLKSGLSFYFTSFAEAEEINNIYLSKSNLCEGDVVLDLGAYCGVSTYYFSKLVGETGRVYSFEPDLANFTALLYNIHFHQLKNVVPVQKGIWRENTKLCFQAEGNMGSAISDILERVGNQQEIECITLSDAIKFYNLKKVNFIKMDIEGAEVEVIRASKDLFRDRHFPLIIEPHYYRGVLTTESLVGILQDAGYMCEVLPQPGTTLPLLYAHVI